MTWKEVLKAEKQQFEKKGAKPDYIDIDGDGNKTEPMKEAAKDAKMKKSKTADSLYTEEEALQAAKIEAKMTGKVQLVGYVGGDKYAVESNYLGFSFYNPDYSHAYDTKYTVSPDGKVKRLIQGR